MSDLLAPLLELTGVAEAAEAAREGLAKAHRHRTNLRNWPVTAAESAIRGARSSSAIDGGAVQLDGSGAEPNDPVLAGALRVGQALEGGTTALVGVWQRAPLQAVARLHALAAADLTDEEKLGRPRQDPEVSARLDLVTRLVTGASSAPAPILASVAHGEVLALAPFGVGDGIVARAVSRLVTMATGLDPHGLGVPEVYWMRRADEYRCSCRRVRDRLTGSGGRLAAAVLPSAGRRCARSGVDRRGGGQVGPARAADMKRATIREEFGSPPASTVTRLPSVQRGLRGLASAVLRCASVAIPPKGCQVRPLLAITQARNTYAISRRAPRGYQEPCWAAWLGS